MHSYIWICACISNIYFIFTHGCKQNSEWKIGKQIIYAVSLSCFICILLNMSPPHINNFAHLFICVYLSVVNVFVMHSRWVIACGIYWCWISYSKYNSPSINFRCHFGHLITEIICLSWRVFIHLRNYFSLHLGVLISTIVFYETPYKNLLSLNPNCLLDIISCFFKYFNPLFLNYLF